MKVDILDLKRQYEELKNEIEPAVCAQLRTGMYIGGEAVSRFEEAFAANMGVQYAIAVNSGTDALVIALKSLGIGNGDEVITTPFTFFATAEAIAMVGAKPVFVDIEETTYNINSNEIEKAISNKTKAILPVHIFGQPANMDEIKKIAKKHQLKIIEDACQAVGAEWDGKKVGGLGDIGCFSFFPTKNLGAFGDGGMITTNDASINVVCRALREHGMAQNGAKARYILEGVEDELLGTKSPEGLYNPYKYYNYLIAYNSRLDALQAVVLNIKLKYLENFNNKRAHIAQIYEEILGGCKEIIIPKEVDKCKHVWHQYAIRSKQKDDMGKFLAENGVSSAAFYPVPLHLQKAFNYLGYKEGDLPIAEMITKQTVCLPIYPELREEEVRFVAETVKSFYENK